MLAWLQMSVLCSVCLRSLATTVWCANCVLPEESKWLDIWVDLHCHQRRRLTFVCASMYAEEALHCGLINKVLGSQEEVLGK